MTVVLTDANGAPTADAQSITLGEDGDVAIALTGSDPDDDGLTWCGADPARQPDRW